ncbi:conserved Plasmodium protein, unknown function [Plasmodium chabaudi chabaudi]|uniref:Uncharacterized protein n=1 Tax=Plasmodium chabaudi chabaudi TaxID=31271 RepID=A0A1D3LDX2_PLACU|nr:conserved Plasmodium protein, unknown function [Plasmodium chabaudi chabaudi]
MHFIISNNKRHVEKKRAPAIYHKNEIKKRKHKEEEVYIAEKQENQGSLYINLGNIKNQSSTFNSKLTEKSNHKRMNSITKPKTRSKKRNKKNILLKNSQNSVPPNNNEIKENANDNSENIDLINFSEHNNELCTIKRYKDRKKSIDIMTHINSTHSNSYEDSSIEDDITITDVSMTTDFGYNMDRQFLNIFEHLNCTKKQFLFENYEIIKSLDIYKNLVSYEIFKKYSNKIFNDMRNINDITNCSYLSFEKNNIIFEKNKNGKKNSFTYCDVNSHLKKKIKKRIKKNWSRKVLIYFPFYRKRIFVEAILEHFEIGKKGNQKNKGNENEDSENNEEENCKKDEDLKTQCYNIIKRIKKHKCFRNTTQCKNKKISESLLISNYFCEKLLGNTNFTKIELDYYEFEFFSIFFLTYFRYTLYLAGFMNSFFLYHSNEIYFHIFVLNRYHYFIDKFYEQYTNMPFTEQEKAQIIIAYKKSIILILDYLDALYPLFILLYKVVKRIKRKVAMILNINHAESVVSNKIEMITTKNISLKTTPLSHQNKQNSGNSNMDNNFIGIFSEIKKINKKKRKIFKNYYDKFILMIMNSLDSYWIVDFGNKQEIKNTNTRRNSNSCEINTNDNNMHINKCIEQTILNMKNNMFIKYIIYSIVLKLISIMSKLENSKYTEEIKICKINILPISTLLTFKSFKNMKKKDKWVLLLKQNYFYIEKSLYFFKELHEKKIIYYQIQNMFRYILTLKINIVYNTFIQYFYWSDILNNNTIYTIYKYVYYVENSTAKTRISDTHTHAHLQNNRLPKYFIIIPFSYKGLVYKLKFDIRFHGFVYSLYNCLKFIFLEKSNLELIEKNSKIENELMPLFNNVINSLSFEKYKNIQNPIKNLIINSFFHFENNILKNILYNTITKINHMRYRGHLRTLTSFALAYQTKLNQAFYELLANEKDHRIEKIDKVYIYKEIKQRIEYANKMNTTTRAYT